MSETQMSKITGLNVSGTLEMQIQVLNLTSSTATNLFRCRELLGYLVFGLLGLQNCKGYSCTAQTGNSSATFTS